MNRDDDQETSRDAMIQSTGLGIRPQVIMCRDMTWEVQLNIFYSNFHS